MELETKAAENREIKEAFDDFLRAFESFKEANDERLAQIERRSADVVTDEKVDRINRALDEQKRALDELTLAAARPALGGEQKAMPDRATRERKVGVRPLCAQGRYLRLRHARTEGAAPKVSGRRLYRAARNRADHRSRPGQGLADPRPRHRAQIGRPRYRKPITTTGAVTGWVAETDARTETTAPVICRHRISRDGALRHAGGDTGAARRFAGRHRAVARQRSADRLRRTGRRGLHLRRWLTAPKGFLSETIVADATWAWSKIGYIASGAAGAFASTDPTDALVSLAYAPKQGYRANGTWVMNRKTEAVIRKFKDGNRQLHLAAGLGGGPAADAARLSGGGSRRHARHRGRIPTPSRSAISRAAI